jgi:Asparagine synthase
MWSLDPSASDIDPLGLTDFLFVGHHLGERTLFRDVEALPAHSEVRVSQNGTVRRSLPLALPAVERCSLASAVDRLDDALDRIYAPYGDLDQLVMPLSGGLDSRVLAARAVEEGFGVHAWTFALWHGSADERFARAVSETLRVPHTVSHVDSHDLMNHVRPFVHATSGHLSLEHIHGYSKRRDLPPGLCASANGIWGDVFFGGSFLLDQPTPASVEESLARRLLGGAAVSDLAPFLPGVPEWPDRLRFHVHERYASVNCDRHFSDIVFMRDRPGRFNVWGSLSVRDRTDYIAPFCSEDVVQACYSIPERWRRGSIAYRQVIARRWPELAEIPWQKTGLRVSKEPSAARRAVRAVRRRTRFAKSTSFASTQAYREALRPLLDEAVEASSSLVADIGIDFDGLSASQPRLHVGLELRLATVYLAIETALTGERGKDVRHPAQGCRGSE